LKQDAKAAPSEFRRIRADTLIGMAFSNIIGISIIITAAATLHAHGHTDIKSSSQAAEALAPLTGHFAELIFALGIIGTGLLAISGSCGIERLCRGRGMQMAGRAFAEAEGGGRLLWSACGFRCPRRGD
jgi:type IV secretory pathway VirB2 component (pilin)